MNETWTPAWDRQHEPFEKGNEHALTHGSRSRRRVEEVAAKIDSELIDRAPWVVGYPEALGAYARAEAVSRLIFSDLASNGIYDKKGQFRAALIGRWATAENVAARQRESLGLTPRSEAEVMRDRASAAAIAASADLGELAARGRAARDARAAEVAEIAATTRADDSDDTADRQED